jgi:hypothetical protein
MIVKPLLVVHEHARIVDVHDHAVHLAGCISAVMLDVRVGVDVPVVADSVPSVRALG